MHRMAWAKTGSPCITSPLPYM